MEIDSMAAHQIENLERLRRNYEILLQNERVMSIMATQVIANHKNIMDRISVLTEPFLLHNVYPVLIRCLEPGESI